MQKCVQVRNKISIKTMKSAIGRDGLDNGACVFEKAIVNYWIT